MRKRIPQSGMTPGMKVNAKRMRTTKGVRNKIARKTLAGSISNATTINLNTHLMTSLARKYKVNTANGTQFAELMEAIKTNRVSIYTPYGQSEIARVFLGPNPSMAQIEELRNILSDYRKQMNIQRDLKNATSGIREMSVSVSSGRVYVKEKGFLAKLLRR
ncbi:MAG: hypothetical protein GX950_01775 [Candidatus Diapherotrites archaeon]|jgi:hypothetical protein|uniref:Uncharacterized protein n=1 Tax=Candidatus Iainarchaeum sp. TaxID=3101447 RepID=A0A7K4BZA0_9ARCH|nr:hypothetical protein [Candidatus Diapherotrites archaeon]